MCLKAWVLKRYRGGPGEYRIRIPGEILAGLNPRRIPRPSMHGKSRGAEQQNPSAVIRRHSVERDFCSSFNEEDLVQNLRPAVR